jgi:hypothetical protein
MIVQVHPIVFVSISDHHLRCSKPETGVVGALFGTATDTTIEVTNAVPVASNVEGDKVRLLPLPLVLFSLF